MAFSFDQIFAADPSNPFNVAQNASVTIFAPGDGTMTPLTITDPDGQPLANPIPVNANGFGSAFAHATLDRVAWAGGGFTGFFTSYEGMKGEAVAAREAAEQAAANAASEAGAALATAVADADAAADAAATAASNSTAAAANATNAATAAANAAALVGAPADAAIAAAMNGTGATKTALNIATAQASKTDDALARSQAMAFAAVPQPIPRWRTKLATDAANAKIVGMGDSTTDEVVEAVNLWNRLRTYHTAAGQGLAGMNPANIVSYGHNGTKLSDWWGNATWKAEITGSGAHLVILSYGINDFRLGTTTQAAFRALLIQVVDYLRAQMPNTDIVLRIPNSFTSDNTHAWSVGWVVPATPEASQKYSAELRNAYLSLIDYWSSGVAVWDAQGRIFGVTAKPFAETEGLMKDILHPSAAAGYPAIADALVEDIIGHNAVPARVTAATAKPLLDIVGRADNASSAGVATTGQAYVTTIGAFAVSAHQLYNPNATLSRTTINGGTVNGEYGVTLAVDAIGAAWGFRYSDPANFLYISHGGASGKYELWKKVADATTLVATFSTVTPANGDRLMVKADGTLVKVYINGTLMGSYEFPQNTGGTYLTLQANNTTPRFTELYTKPY